MAVARRAASVVEAEAVVADMAAVVEEVSVAVEIVAKAAEVAAVVKVVAATATAAAMEKGGWEAAVDCVDVAAATVATAPSRSTADLQRRWCAGCERSQGSLNTLSASVAAHSTNLALRCAKCAQRRCGDTSAAQG